MKNILKMAFTKWQAWEGKRSAKLLALLALIAMVVVYSCKKPYTPPVIASEGNYLVVEGAINSGTDSSFLKLSRTVSIASKMTANPELNAVLTVEGEQGTTYALVEKGKGVYATGALNLDNAHKYRLRIKTSNQEEYLSDYVAVLNSPPIDSVSYTKVANGVNIYSNTHDPANNVKYYRWDYIETYMFHSNYDSHFVSNGDTVLSRTDQIYWCFRSDSATSINIASTAKQTKAVIVNNPIIFIPSTSEKFTQKYSIIVRQYALTSDAYAFWDNVKKNTEQLGSIFDAQPSSIPGNIHCISTPSKPIIGYVSIGNVTSQRIFISATQLPGYYTTQFYTSCSTDSLMFVFTAPGGTKVYQEDEFYNFNKPGFNHANRQIPIDAFKKADTLAGHTGAAPECVDCTLRGTTRQPSFWQ